MTREEAINNNKNLRMYMRFSDKNQPYKFLEENYIALDMAIKALEQDPKYIETIDFAIDASDGDTNYFVGFRNGLRYAKSLINGEEPQFESCVDQEPCEDASYNSIKYELNGDMISRQAVNEIINDIRDCISVEGYWAFLERVKKLPAVEPQNCDKCEVGNPCLYCRHEFEPQERGEV